MVLSRGKQAGHRKLGVSYREGGASYCLGKLGQVTPLCVTPHGLSIHSLNAMTKWQLALNLLIALSKTDDSPTLPRVIMK